MSCSFVLVLKDAKDLKQLELTIKLMFLSPEIEIDEEEFKIEVRVPYRLKHTTINERLKSQGFQEVLDYKIEGVLYNNLKPKEEKLLKQLQEARNKRARSQPKRLETTRDNVAPSRKLAKKKTKTKTKSTSTGTKSMGTDTESQPRRGSAHESHLSDTSWDEDELCLSTDEAPLPCTVNIKRKHTASSYLCCRLCAHSFDPRLLIDIFDPSLELATLIPSLLYIPISIRDRKPLQVCQKCAIRLEKFAQFARTVQTSDAYFTACLAKGTTFRGVRSVRRVSTPKDTGERSAQSTRPPSPNPSSTRDQPRVGLKLRVKLASNGTPSQIVNHTSQELNRVSQQSSQDLSQQSSQLSHNLSQKSGQRTRQSSQDSEQSSQKSTHLSQKFQESSQLVDSSHPNNLRPVPNLIACVKTEVKDFPETKKDSNENNESCALSGESVQDYFNSVQVTSPQRRSTSKKTAQKSSSSALRTRSSVDSRLTPKSPPSTRKTVRKHSDLPRENSTKSRKPVSNTDSAQPAPSSQDSVPNYSDSSQSTPSQESVPDYPDSLHITPSLDSGSQYVEAEYSPDDESDADTDPGALCIVDIKEEPLDIVDEIKEEQGEEEEEDMFETHHAYNMGGFSGDSYLSYSDTASYSLPAGAGFDTQSSYESNDASYDQQDDTMDSKDNVQNYMLAPRKRGRPKGSKNRNMTAHPAGGMRSKVFITDQYEVNFMHECRRCGSQFSDILKHSMEAHLSLECPCCMECFTDRPALVEHFQNVHNTKSQVIYFPCPLCPDKLRTDDDLNAHVTAHAHSILAPYECFSCEFSDNDFMVMAKHIVERHCELTADNRYECPICEEQETMADSFDELCTHLYRAHIPEDKANLVQCPVCNLTLGNDTSHIRSHLLTHTTRQTFIRPKYYRCPACNAGFKSQINLVKHACPNIVNNRCEECKITFPSKMRHTFHLQHHLEDPMQLKCDICFTDFDDENSLYDHVRFIHVQDNQLKCHICNKENFKNQLSLSIHMRYHENVREYECETCKKKFINKSTLKEHSVSHMSVKPFKCEICGHYLSRASRLRAHLKAHSVVASNNKVQNCKKCFKCCQVFPSCEETLRKHFEKVHFDCEYQADHFHDVVLKCVYRCEFCDSCFNETHELNRHRFANHPEPESPTAFSCLVCGVAFPAYSRLTTHKLTHGINTESLILTDEDEKNDRFRIVQYFLCELCDKTSIHYTYLCLHKKLKHANLNYGGGTPVCGACNLSFKNEWQYLVHNRTVHEAPPDPSSNASAAVLTNNPHGTLRKAKNHVKSVTCDVCSKAFSSKENCKAHYVRQHMGKTGKELAPAPVRGDTAREEKVGNNSVAGVNGNKPFICEICGKQYTVEASLLSHYDVHSGEFYQCDVCYKEFRSTVTLRTHTRRHDNYSCDECQTVCQDVNGLRCHTMREHGYKILSCEKCDVKFTTKTLLAEHINTKHNADVTLKCVMCNVTFNREEVEHHQAQHNRKVLLIRCESCTETFDSFELLSSHLNFKHTNQFLMKCVGCDLLVPQAEIVPHLSLKHPQGSPACSYECNQCKEKSNDVATMLNHYSNKHHMDVNISCAACDVLFHNKGSLYKHLYLEHKLTGLRIECHICFLALDTKESVVAHITRHHTLQFPCTRCSSTFLNSASLTRHIKTEHGSKSHQCNECPESFERLNKLKRHKFTAHNNSLHQIQCPYCITDFSEDKNLIQHILSVHLGHEKTAPIVVAPPPAPRTQ
uniref:Zinc finger protein 91 n=2 Tax=Cacopsylla melanoneura TaxID=428564 RepID=A0A8D8YAR8_9HEMI